MEKIEIGYFPIGATGGFAHHKFILYTKSDGTSFQIHGGGDGDIGSSNLDEFLTNTSGSGSFGILKVTVFETSDRTEIESDIQRETVFEGGGS